MQLLASFPANCVLTLNGKVSDDNYLVSYSQETKVAK